MKAKFRLESPITSVLDTFVQVLASVTRAVYSPRSEWFTVMVLPVAEGIKTPSLYQLKVVEAGVEVAVSVVVMFSAIFW